MISGINPEKITRYIARHVLFFSLTITVFLVDSANAQYWVNENKTWAIWRNDGLDFNSGVPVPITTGISSAEGSASISDPSGALLFCTDGYFIWDRSGNPMDNSDDLLGTGSLSSQTISTSQSAVILPVPDTPGRYYVFSLTQNERGPEAGKLYYSVVDIALNGGLGGVIPGRKAILLDTGLTEKLTITPGQRCNIWLLTTTKWIAGVKAFEITAAGLSPTPVFTPTPFPYGNYDAGVMKVSPDGRKIAVCNIQDGGLSLFDFDGASGTVSNGMLIDAGSGYYGAAFSPDNTKLYTSQTGISGTVYQYEVNLDSSIAIRNSRIRISNAVFTDLKLGPDGKIYLKSPTGGASIAVIHEPNIKGTACRYEANAIQLLSGSTDLTRSGFPNEVALLIKDTVRRSYDIAYCFTDSVLLSVDTSGWDYTWDDGSSGPGRQVYASGTYSITYFTPPCRLNRDTFRVQMLSPSLSAEVYAPCGGEEGHIRVNPGVSDSNSYHYSWRDAAGNILREQQSTKGDTFFNITAPSEYTVRVTSPGCDTLIRFVVPDPSGYAAAFIAPDYVCTGDTITFQNTSVGLNDYIWHFGDGDSSSATDPVHTYVTPGAYRVMLIGYPCRDTAIRLITVDSTPYVRFTASTDPGCSGEIISFRPHHPEGGTGYAWSFGDGHGTSTEQRPEYRYGQEGIYDVTLTVTFRACPDTTFSAPVTVFPSPVVLLSGDTAICPGDPGITLSNLAEDQHAGTYLWSTGARSETIHATDPGDYSLTITAGNCSTSDTVHIGKSCQLDIPNVFTPNGDGINDYFFPRDVLARGLLSFRIQLFNRWGQLIYESTSLSDKGWDGTHNGHPLPPGVYVYSIRAVFRNGITEHYPGNITLIR